MRVDLQIDSAQLVLRLRNGQRRLAYAAVNAINNTAKRIQAAERRRVEEEFTVRKKQFIRRARGSASLSLLSFASVGSASIARRPANDARACSSSAGRTPSSWTATPGSSQATAGSWRPANSG